MYEAFKKLTKYQQIIVFIIIIVVVYFAYKQTENFESTDNTEFKQKEPEHSPVLYDRKTGIVTAASEFIGLPDEILPAWGNESVSNYGKIDRIDDGYNGAMGLNYNMCSKSCCGPQYPPPFELEDDALVEKIKDQFVPNNYSCNNAWNNTGCVCMTKKQHEYIGSRGGNA